jgi:hypothetical protein
VGFFVRGKRTDSEMAVRIRRNLRTLGAMPTFVVGMLWRGNMLAVSLSKHGTQKSLSG